MTIDTPDRKLIERMTLALDMNTVHELVTSHGLSLIKDCLSLLADLRKNEDKALMCEFCLRHGGLTKVCADFVFMFLELLLLSIGSSIFFCILLFCIG